MQNLPEYYSVGQEQFYVVKDEYLTLENDVEKIKIVNSIPRFVTGTNYSDAFGIQWNKYRLTQLDSFSGISLSRDRLKNCMGEALWNNLSGKNILEAGCGAGRFTEILLEKGANVMSIDLSNAVDANRDNFPINERHKIAQADINNLPFKPQQFDIVLCIGVIQHTPDPEQTISSLYNHVKKGGYLIVDHYRPCFNRIRLKFIFRLILKRLSPEKGFIWSERLVNIFLPIHKFFRNNYLALAILSRISPINSYYHNYFPRLNHKQIKEWALLDTHDTLTDKYKHLRSPNQIKKTLEKMDIVNIVIQKAGNSVEARGMRP